MQQTSITVSEIITVVSVIVAIVSVCIAAANYNRGGAKQLEQGAQQIATILTKLDVIENDIKDIKAQQRALTNELNEMRAEIIKAQLRADAAHERIDQLVTQKGHHHG